MNLKLKAKTGLKWTTVSSVIVTLLQLVQFAILTRFLAPSDFGLMALVMIVIGFSQAFLGMGISNAIIHKQEITDKQLSTLYWVNVLVGIVLFGIIFIISPFIAGFYGEPELTKLIIIVGLTFIIQPFGQQFMILWQKELRFKEIAKIDIVNKSISLIVSTLLAIKGYGVYALVFGVLAGAISQTILFMYVGMKEYKPSFVFIIGDIKEFLSFGAFQMGEKSINYFSANIDKIFLGKFVGMEGLGFYNLAWQLVIFPLVKINPIVNKVAFPVFSKIQNNLSLLSKYYGFALRTLSLLTIPIFVFMFFYSYEIVKVIYGQGWEETALLIRILSIVGILKALGNPAGALMLALGRADIGFWWNVAWASTVTLTLYISLSYSPTINIVAYSLLILSLPSSVVWNYIIYKVSHIDILALWKKLGINIVIIIIIGWFSFYLTYLLGIEHYVWKLVFSGFISLIIYIQFVIKTQKDIILIIRDR